ncbi:MAG TPA: hypothetical protein VEH50_03120 [Methylomirabilota bacterium]|nr:hypothetical protein [Methylomirabilota bacterium]
MVLAENLRRAIGVLSETLRILPATGGAVEYLQRPDAEEVDDERINSGVDIVDEFAETNPPSSAATNIFVPPKFRREKHLFRFFLDGSLRTYFLGTGVERGRSFPIMLAQIGASCVRRSDTGQLSLHRNESRVLLLAPKGGDGISDGVWEDLRALNSPDLAFQVIDINQHAVNVAKGEIDPRNKAGGVARNRMHELEIEVIDSADGLLSENSWMILDGAVKLTEFVNTPSLIGVAKSFSKKPQFHFSGSLPQRHIDVTGLLEGLEFAHRTPAFASYGGKVAFWYLRLWPYKHLDYPLMGVIKVELPTPKTQPAETDLVNELSRCLIGERSVTPYGQDPRWHCHLYPIFCAESATKARFMTGEVLLGHVRWPAPTGI